MLCLEQHCLNCVVSGNKEKYLVFCRKSKEVCGRLRGHSSSFWSPLVRKATAHIAFSTRETGCLIQILQQWVWHLSALQTQNFNQAPFQHIAFFVFLFFRVWICKFVDTFPGEHIKSWNKCSMAYTFLPGIHAASPRVAPQAKKSPLLSCRQNVISSQPNKHHKHDCGMLSV